MSDKENIAILNRNFLKLKEVVKKQGELIEKQQKQINHLILISKVKKDDTFNGSGDFINNLFNGFKK